MKELEIGYVVNGQFRIDAVLGAGGFATVYRASDLLGGERPVAIKLLRPDDRDSYHSATRIRFEREVAILTELRSEHTLRLLGYGVTEQGWLFLASEYVEGEDLSDVLARVGTLSPDIVEHIVRQLLDSLEEAHNAGLIHRDIKPDNIRIFQTPDDPWRVKLLDFGIARSTDDSRPALTATGELVGTPRYMSPEQLTGNPLTAASDLYSLGMASFEMLFGSSALQGQRFGDQLERLQSGYVFAAPGEQTRLHDVVQRMLARKPEARFSSATGVRAALDGHDASRRPGVPLADTAGGARPWWPAALAVIVIAFATVLLWPKPTEPPAPVLSRRAHNSLVRPDQPTEEPIAADEPSKIAPPTASSNAVLHGCGRRPPFKKFGNLRFASDLNRPTWPAYIPSSYQTDQPQPLVVLIHGRNESAEPLLRMSGFPKLAEEHGFVVIAPQSQALTEIPDIDPWEDADERLIFEMYDETIHRLCIDPSKVFIVTQGQSEFLIDVLSCEDWVAGVAIHAGRRGPIKMPGCDRRTPTMIINPLNSPLHPVDGSKNCNGHQKRPLPVLLDLWQKHQVCGEPGPPHALPHGTCRTWTCEAPFTSCDTDGGGAWPRMPTAIDGKCVEKSTNFPIADQIWDFFETSARQAPAAGERTPDAGSR